MKPTLLSMIEGDRIDARAMAAIHVIDERVARTGPYPMTRHKMLANIGFIRCAIELSNREPLL